MRIRCKICSHEFDLNEDSLSARSTRTDPHQQMRLHLLSHPIETMRHAHKIGWLIDAMAFNAAEDRNLEDKTRFRDSLIRLVDHFQESE